jgi:type I restriction enzyme M protein
VSEEVSHLSLTDVANRAGVRLSAVSNWRVRYLDFPRPRLVLGQEVFEAREIAQWLQGRKIPRNRLRSNEQPGTSYGDRFMHNVDTSGSQIAATASYEAQLRESEWAAQLWTAADALRGSHDTASSLEFLLGLVYVRTHRTDVWQSPIDASGWPEVREVLSGVSLSMGVGVPPVPVFRMVAHTTDSSVIEAVRLIAEINLGNKDGPESIGAQISAAILAKLERGMGRSGGHFTPPDVARCLVELLDPQLSDRVYDPFCGSGELLSAAAAYVNRTRDSLDDWQVYGQTPHEWSWLTSTMNLALHGVKADLGMPGNALQVDRLPDRRFSRIIANPAFNLKLDLPKDRAWPFGEPPTHNANFAWLQHVVTKLEPDGRAAVVMPAGAGFVLGRERSIRQAMVEAGVIECVIALPPHLFSSTGISTMVWILCSADATPPLSETLFIDARDLGEMVDRTKRQLGASDIGRIVNDYQMWRNRGAAWEFTGTHGLSRAVGHDEIRENDYQLTPGRYTELAAKRPDTLRVTAELGALRD